MKSVPILDVARQNQETFKAAAEAVERVLQGGRYILGPEVSKLEQSVALMSGATYGVGVASGTDALILALQAVGVKPGDEVVTTPFSFIATATAIARMGARPVFADIEPDTLNISVAAAERVVTSKTRALLPVHLFGLPADLNGLMKLATAHNLAVIEDTAQALGADYQGNPVGGVGTAGCTSFYPTKNLGGSGDGGAVVTSDEGVYERLRQLRDHGKDKSGLHQYYGMNSRLDELQAAILNVKIDFLHAWNRRRQTTAAIYREVESPHFQHPVSPSKSSHICHHYVVRCAEREKLTTHLKEKGIGFAIYYDVPIHLQPCFSDLGYKPGDMPEVEKAAGECLALPVHHALTSEEIDRVASALSEFRP